jgi:cytochrome c551/c552
MKTLRPVAGLIAFMVSASVSAADVPAVITAKRCNACHDVSATLIGPSYVAIALRHAQDKDNMVEVLARKIVLGGGGNWGVVPMVPNEHVSLEEARTMARWILEVRAPQS